MIKWYSIFMCDFMKIFLFDAYLLILTLMLPMDMRFFIKFQRREMVLCQKGYCLFYGFRWKRLFLIGKHASGRKNNFFRKKIEIHPGEIGTTLITEVLTMSKFFATSIAEPNKSISFAFDMTSHASHRTAHPGRSSSFYIVASDRIDW